MIKFLLIVFMIATNLNANDANLKKGENFCKKGEIDSALYYLNLIEDEITIETTTEDIFLKNYLIAKCYDQLKANKSAEYYYLKSLKIMDSSDIDQPDIYLDLANFYERIYNYKGANQNLRLFYQNKLELLNEEINISNEKISRLDSLETKINIISEKNIKVNSDVRLLIVLISVFGAAFLISLIIILRNKKTSVQKTEVK